MHTSHTYTNITETGATCADCGYLHTHTIENHTCAGCGLHIHYECGATCTHEGEQAHENIKWQALADNFTGGVLATGNYYLDRDIQLTEPITFNSNEAVNLCLNGYVLKAPTTGDNCSVFFIDSGKGANNVTLNITDCSDTVHKFTPNTSGLWVLDEANGTKTVTGGVITGGAGLLYPDGTIGGAIYIYGNSTVNIYGANVVGNTATKTGGAVYMNGGTDNVPSLNVYGGGFYGNKAGSAGGAIYALYEFFSSNSTYRENTANNGGAIYIGGSGTTTVTGDTYQSNKATSGDAGAIVVRDTATLISNNSVYNQNTASMSGGAVFGMDNTIIAINGCDFTENHAIGTAPRTNGNGGAIGTKGKLTISKFGEKGNTFIGNRALYGGAIRTWDGKEHAISDSTFIGNKAQRSGGAVFTESNTTVNNATFTENIAGLDNSSGDGGAIRIGNTSNPYLKLIDTTITNNSIYKNGNGGGVCCYNSTTLKVGGKVIIDENLEGISVRNVSLLDTTKIEIVEPLESGSVIGYRVRENYAGGMTIVSSGASKDDVVYFYNDITGKTNAGYYEEYNGGTLISKYHSSHSYGTITPNSEICSVCSVCGFKRQHNFDENSTCTGCGAHIHYECGKHGEDCPHDISNLHSYFYTEITYNPLTQADIDGFYNGDENCYRIRGRILSCRGYNI